MVECSPVGTQNEAVCEAAIRGSTAVSRQFCSFVQMYMNCIDWVLKKMWRRGRKIKVEID